MMFSMVLYLYDVGIEVFLCVKLTMIKVVINEFLLVNKKEKS